MNSDIPRLVSNVLTDVNADDDTDRANTLRELAEALVKKANTLGTRTLDALAAEIIADMPDKVNLIYVDQGDKLTDEQVALLVAGDHEKLWQSLEEWESESSWYGITQFTNEAVKDVIAGWEKEDDADYSELADAFDNSDAFDNVREALQERESGDWFRSLLRGCPDVLMRILVLNEDQAYSHEEVAAERVLADVRMPDTPENRATVQYALDNASPEYSSLMGFWIIGADVEQLNELDKLGATEVDITDPHLYLGNPLAGDGFITEEPLRGTVRVKRSDLRTDKAAFGYAVSDIYGGLSGSQYSATLTAVSPPARTDAT